MSDADATAEDAGWLCVDGHWAAVWSATTRFSIPSLRSAGRVPATALTREAAFTLSLVLCHPVSTLVDSYANF